MSGKKKGAEKAAENPADLVKNYLRLHDAGRRNYERADAVLARIAALVPIGGEIPLSENGKKAILIDRFEGKNLVFQPCGARRYELKIKNA